MPDPKAFAVLSQFGLSGTNTRIEPISQGLINESFLVFSEGDPKFVLQRINSRIFSAPALLMENIRKLLPVLEGDGYSGLSLKETSTGTLWYEDKEGSFWRMFRYIPDSFTREVARDPATAREAGRIIGRFHQLVSRVPVSEVHTTLEGFQDLELRARQLEAAIENGNPARVDKAGSLLELSGKLIAFCKEIPLSSLPLRICHHDTKLSNILYDRVSGKALCLIDLDTLMPGYLLYDFGDAARILLNPVGESDAGKVKTGLSLKMFEAFAEGWFSSGLEMEPQEVSYICHGIVLMSTLHGIRTLADYLLGDLYYRTTYPEQNLDRATDMLKFASMTAEKLPELQVIIEKMQDQKTI